MALLPPTRRLCNSFVPRIKLNFTSSSKLASSHSTFNENLKTSECAKRTVQQLNSTELNFRDARVAHVSKNNWQLIRGLIMKFGRTILGKYLFSRVMLYTFYGHFVAGETLDDVKPVARNLRKYGVKSILDYSVEKDIEESEAVDKVKESLAEVIRDPEIRPDTATKQFQTSLRFADRSKQVVAARTYFYESEYQCDKNMDSLIQSFESISHTTDKEGFAAIKLTALGRPQLLLQMSDFLVQMERLFYALIGLQIEGDKEPSEQLRALDLENFQKRLDMLGVQISYDEKTGKVEQLVPMLTEDGLEQMRNMFNRMDNIAKHAKSAGIRVMIDAEQTYFQPAIRRLTMEMMRLFNRDSGVIYGTYQCYLKDAAKYLHQDLYHAVTEDFHFGAKLVRGAYMDQTILTIGQPHEDLGGFDWLARRKERARAATLGYDDPVCANYDATTAMFETCIDSVLQSITERPLGKVAVMIASHNENTIDYALHKMKEFGVTPEQRQICFGQLYGMCDHLSFTLGQSGYSTFKYVPYGPVDEVLPYLSRRAVENSCMFSKTKLELQLMRTELKRRLMAGKLFHRSWAQD